MYGDEYIQNIEKQITEIAKRNNYAWSEKNELAHTQEIKKLLATIDEPHVLATVAIWCSMNREDDAVVRKIHHYDKMIEIAFYQCLFAITDLDDVEAKPAVRRIMEQVNLEGDTSAKIRECMSSLIKTNYSYSSRIYVRFGDKLFNEKPVAQDIAQFIVPLRAALWRSWDSPTNIPSTICAKSQFTISDKLGISNIKVDVVEGPNDRGTGAATFKPEYKRQAIIAINHLKITEPLPRSLSKLDVYVDFYGP